MEDQPEWGICLMGSPLYKNNNIGCHPLARPFKVEGSVTTFYCAACGQQIEVSKRPKLL